MRFIDDSVVAYFFGHPVLGLPATTLHPVRFTRRPTIRLVHSAARINSLIT